MVRRNNKNLRINYTQRNFNLKETEERVDRVFDVLFKETVEYEKIRQEIRSPWFFSAYNKNLFLRHGRCLILG